MATATYPAKNEGKMIGLTYTALGLGEVGEYQGKLKKIIRDDDGIISDEKRLQMKKELGDILWYVAASAAELGFLLSEVAGDNIAKLADRKARGVIQGSGDNR